MAGCRAVLLGENRLFRDGIRQMLERSGIAVIGEGREIDELLQAVGDQACPDLAILHLASDQAAESRLDCAVGLRRQFGDAKLVVLADPGAKSALPAFFHADVSAILLTEISSGMLERSLELVLSDHRLFPADIMSRVTGGLQGEQSPPALAAEDAEILAVDEAPHHGLSPALSRRECQVVRCLAVGLSNKTIARELNITEGTVKVHVKGLLRKVKAANRTQLAIWALRQAHLIGGEPVGLEAGAKHAA